MSKEKDFEQIYKNNVAVLKNKKSLVDINKSGAVYSVFPAKYDYMNEDLVCMKISLQSARLFLETSSFVTYAKSLALVQKSLADNYYRKASSVSKEDLFGSTRSLTDHIFSNYKHTYKFVKGSFLTEEIIKHALTLKNNEKSSIIISIGNHSITVVLENKEDKIRVGYYDVELSQLYFQKVSKQELSDSLKTNLFKHPLSIVNQENYLLSRIFALSEDVLDSSMPLAFMSFVSDVKDPNLLPPTIGFADHLTQKEVIKSFSYQFNMYKNVRSTTNRFSYFKFISDNKNEIINNFLNFKKCASLAAEVSEYSSSAFTAFKNGYLSFGNEIDNIGLISAASRYVPSKKLTEVGSVSLCVKNATVDSKVITAEGEYLLLLSKEKALMHKALSSCLSKFSDKEKKLEVNKLASYFTDDKFTGYNSLKNKFFHARDIYRESKDINCYNSPKSILILNDVTNDDISNFCVGVNQDLYNTTITVSS